MTPEQYYFPYFFDQYEFNDKLRPLGLSSYFTYDDNQNLKGLKIIKYLSFQAFKPIVSYLEIPYWTTFMLQDNYLVYWTSEENQIEISHIDLIALKSKEDLKELKIAMEITTIDDLNITITNYGSTLDILHIIDFVTFVRLRAVHYDQDYYEQYCIVVINGTEVNITPFEYFNKTGGDYGYVWPAVARLDMSSLKLYGRGMRMSDFVVDLNDKKQ